MNAIRLIEFRICRYAFEYARVNKGARYIHVIRDPKDVFNLDSQTLAAQGKLADAQKFVHDWKVKPPTSCSGCHR